MEPLDFKKLGIGPNIRKALGLLGYHSPMEVQSKVIPMIMEDRDLIVKSQTGSGKTAAFAIPLCEKVEVEERAPQALVLVPTRELALQIKEDIKNIGRFKKVRAAALYGRHPIELQKGELRQRVHIVVGTPGRTMDHIRRENLDLSRIKYLVLDEADEMLNMGFIDQVKEIIHQLPKNRCTLLFSATLPERIQEVCEEYMKDSIRVEVDAGEAIKDRIHQYYYRVEEKGKEALLQRILLSSNPGSCILFCNTRDRVEALAKFMRRKRYSSGSLHGGMTQRERIQTIHQFKRGEIQYLIATDVAARGIDVEDITHVINVEVPFEKESYIHRMGRTARMSKRGVAITLLSSKEQHRFDEIQSYIGYRIPERSVAALKVVSVKNHGRGQNRLKPKRNKAGEINREITRLRLNAGRKKKIRPVDVMGVIGNIDGIKGQDIGIIDIQDTCTYVEIFNGKGQQVLKGLQNNTIKGRKFSVKEIKKH